MVYSLWITILMGVGYETPCPTAGLTSLVQKRKKETNMSKEDKKKELDIDLSKYSTGSVDTFTVDMSSNGIKESDITITIDGKPLSAMNTDSITVTTLKEIEHDAIVLNTDVKQGDLFNGWPEDGPPDPTTVTIQNLQEDDGYSD